MKSFWSYRYPEAIKYKIILSTVIAAVSNIQTVWKVIAEETSRLHSVIQERQRIPSHQFGFRTKSMPSVI